MTADARSRSFGEIAESYDAARPVAAPGALDWVLPPDATDVVDLGAGTGLLTRLLVAAGRDTVAVDPDPRMLEVLRRQSPDVPVYVATAESLPLPDASVDAVLASRAWHHFDQDVAPLEIARILRPGGRVATVGTILDPRLDWVAALAERCIVEQGVALPWDAVAAPLVGPFTAPERAEFRWTASTDVDDIVDQVAAWSPVFGAPPDVRAELLAYARGVVEEVSTNGHVEATYRTLCFRCDRLPGATR